MLVTYPNTNSILLDFRMELTGLSTCYARENVADGRPVFLLPYQERLFALY